MRALVTGAAGLIGSHVARALVARGAEVVAFDLPTADARNLAGLPVTRARGDVTRADDVRAAMRGVTHVFHLAAVFSLDPRAARRMRDVNVGGTRVVLASAREAGVRRVVHTSSIARFGGQGRDVRATEASPFRLGPTLDGYSISKAEAHEVAVHAAATMDVVIAAPCGPIGEGDVGPTPTGRLLLTALRSPLVALPRSYTTFADVKDMADAHVLCALAGGRGESYLLGAEDWSMEDLARAAARAAGLRRAVVRVPHSAAGAAAWALALGAAATGRPPLFTPESARIARLGLRADCSKIRALGATFGPVEPAIGRALAWFAREGYLSGATSARAGAGRSSPAPSPPAT